MTATAEQLAPARVCIPYVPRPGQRAFHGKLKRFSVLVLHRRFGKTVFAINQLVRDVVSCPLEEPRGGYIAPFRSQAKTIAWNYVKKFTSPIPGMAYNESELRADFPNGGRITLFGADNLHALRGGYFDSVVLDEVAQLSPSLWDQVVRPMTSDRKGSALFIGTPFGMSNAFYRLWEMAGEHPESWMRALVTAEESGVIDPEELELLREQMAREDYEQEFLCSWSAAIKGAYYSSEMAAAENEGRITELPYDSAYPVVTSWDLGVRDSTVVWYWQLVGAQIRAIRCEAFQGSKLADIIAQVKSHGYNFMQHIAPHDINVRELGTGSRWMEAARHGVKFSVAPAPREVSRQSGINAVRNMLGRTHFDRHNCRDGIEALKTYRHKFDEVRQVFDNNPLHDWTSDYADSVRYMAITRHKVDDWREEHAALDYSQIDMGI